LPLRGSDRALLVWMTRLWPSLLGMAQIVEPATILRWHRAGFRSYWRWKSRSGQAAADRSRAPRSHPTNGFGDGIRDRPISPRSPWQNPYAERLIGTLRRDCLDHVLIFGARHLRQILTAYSC
jgi:hypothetical protein